MACEICTRPTHEWYDCPKKPDGYVPRARRTFNAEVLINGTPSKLVITDEFLRQQQAQESSEGSTGSLDGYAAFGDRLAASMEKTVIKPRNANRHRPGYFTDYMRKRRAAAKEKSRET